ncbi:MAG: hypothetical protein HQK50_12650 [Oligoflexia bacterium]|nr:hypothetical protein [Oligoflexia bacterium]MBF0366413.1 hypothetical protein [Oligoflexia bacterium]
MSAIRKILPLSLLFLLPLTFIVPAIHSATDIPPYRESGKTIGAKALELKWWSSYFDTIEHYGYGGERIALKKDKAESYQKLESEIVATYGAINALDFRGGVRYRRNSSEIVNPRNNFISARASGVESWMVGAKYMLYQKYHWSMAADTFFRIASYRLQSASSHEEGRYASSIILGDGGNEYGVGFHLSKLLVDYLSFSSSFTYIIPEELSRELEYMWEFAYAWKKVALVLGTKGVHSFENDDYSDIPNQKPALNTGATYLYNSVNRAYIAPYAVIGLQLLRTLKFEFQYTRYMNGYSTDGGNEYSFALTWRGGGRTARQDEESRFKEYDIEASIIKISPKEGFVVVDKGISHDLEKGMRVDIYQFDYKGGNVLLATGFIFESKTDTAVVKITNFYRKISLEIGQMVRATRRVE